jgi:dipeptidase
MYSSMTKTPHVFAVGNGSMSEYSETSAFWIFNQVANFAYLRYDVMAADVCRVMHEIEDGYLKDVLRADAEAQALYAKNPKKAQQYLTDYSIRQADATFQRWKKLSQFMLVKYIDGNIKKEKDGVFEMNKSNTTVASPIQPGYPEEWHRKIVEETGDKLRVIDK